jgi:hypothetical protein
MRHVADGSFSTDLVSLVGQSMSFVLSVVASIASAAQCDTKACATLLPMCHHFHDVSGK